MKTKKVKQQKTRYHKVLFDSESPYTHKVERKRTAYTRKPKYKDDEYWHY